MAENLNIQNNQVFMLIKKLIDFFDIYGGYMVSPLHELQTEAVKFSVNYYYNYHIHVL